MGRINWSRVLLGGLVAGLVWTLLSVLVLALFGRELTGALPGAPLRNAGAGLHLYMLVANFLSGIWAMWLYAAIRPRFGRGPRTALVAGLAWWLIVTLQSSKWVALSLDIPSVAVKPVLATLPAILVATVLGAMFYQE